MELVRAIHQWLLHFCMVRPHAFWQQNNVSERSGERKVATDQPAFGRRGRECGGLGVIGGPHILVGCLTLNILMGGPLRTPESDFFVILP